MHMYPILSHISQLIFRVLPRPKETIKFLHHHLVRACYCDPAPYGHILITVPRMVGAWVSSWPRKGTLSSPRKGKDLRRNKSRKTQCYWSFLVLKRQTQFFGIGTIANMIFRTFVPVIFLVMASFFLPAMQGDVWDKCLRLHRFKTISLYEYL